ncbi:MAG: hypothetical protein HY401_08520 [Elusimicrobia bacterium]|nr:hypothetical protein [Elusimicrobiota bacterium]
MKHSVSIVLSWLALGGSWSQAALPVPTHANLKHLGYFYAAGRYGDFTSEVAGYTNLFIVWSNGYSGDCWQGCGSAQAPQFQQGLQNAFNANKDIYIGIGHVIPDADWSSRWSDMLDIAKPFWSKVKYLELYDEPDWDKNETEAKLNELKNLLNQKGMANRPMGIIYTTNAMLTGDAFTAPSLNWVGIEGYINAPGSPDSQTNVNNLNSLLDQSKARVPSGKQIIFTMMAYDRNGNWTNIPTLADLQEPVYLKAFNDSRVIAITMYSYARPGGSRDHPELKAKHQNIAQAMGLTAPLGDTTPPTVNINTPANNSTITQATIVLARATDNIGVTKVEFYVDGVLKFTDGVPSSLGDYGFSWNIAGYANGAHVILAKAFDAAGNTANSQITLFIGSPGDTTPPVISNVSASSNETVSGIKTISVNATDNVGVAKVEFYIDGIYKAEDTTGPEYTYSWNTALYTNGPHSFYAKAYDTSGNSATSSIFNVTVANASNPNVNGAQFVSHSVPSSMNPGQNYTVSLTMKNNGTTLWTSTGGYKLGSQNPQDNNRWGLSRIFMASGEQIVPNQNKTFNFTVTAPTTPAVYNFQWKMLVENLEWFGDTTTNVSVTVSSSSGNPSEPSDSLSFTEAYAYPNPATGDRVTLQMQLTGPADKIEFRYYTTVGELVGHEQVANPAANGGSFAYKHSWDTSGLVSGTYLYLIQASRSGQSVSKTGKIAIVK